MTVFLPARLTARHNLAEFDCGVPFPMIEQVRAQWDASDVGDHDPQRKGNGDQPCLEHDKSRRPAKTKAATSLPCKGPSAKSRSGKRSATSRAAALSIHRVGVRLELSRGKVASFCEPPLTASPATISTRSLTPSPCQAPTWSSCEPLEDPPNTCSFASASTEGVDVVLARAVRRRAGHHDDAAVNTSLARRGPAPPGFLVKGDRCGVQHSVHHRRKKLARLEARRNPILREVHAR